ncbi:hypothetical protein [Listeria booriae]|uniref:hypothetical protein n=1 Tax=Listeria booriae TaxID=1552123 RepID=UPI001628A18E|nr:hypothetical protein [Listeria booriae]MBC2322459.1 hypothetical protein [Listeria booriae]MCD2206534.1 hypothetical protein [Listeria booriae]
MDMILVIFIGLISLVVLYYLSMVIYFCVTGRPAKIDDVVFWKKTKAFLREHHEEAVNLGKMKCVAICQFICFVVAVYLYFVVDISSIILVPCFAVVYLGANLLYVKWI